VHIKHFKGYSGFNLLPNQNQQIIPSNQLKLGSSVTHVRNKITVILVKEQQVVIRGTLYYKYKCSEFNIILHWGATWNANNLIAIPPAPTPTQNTLLKPNLVNILPQKR